MRGLRDGILKFTSRGPTQEAAFFGVLFGVGFGLWIGFTDGSIPIGIIDGVFLGLVMGSVRAAAQLVIRIADRAETLRNPGNLMFVRLVYGAVAVFQLWSAVDAVRNQQIAAAIYYSLLLVFVLLALAGIDNNYRRALTARGSARELLSSASD